MAQFTRKSFELVAEMKIQDAMREGKFDSLPGLGKPFEFDDTQYDPNWWIRRKMELERLKFRQDKPLEDQ